MSRFVALLPLFSAVLVPGCRRENEPAQKNTEPPTRAVAQWPAGSAGLSYTLARGGCSSSGCAAVIQLVASGRILHTIPLDFTASDSLLQPARADESLGAGDPLSHDSLTAWVSGEGERSVSTAVRSLELSRGAEAIVVDQAVGFDHIKRRHYVFAAKDGQLERVWTGEEGAGPTWSAVVIMRPTTDVGAEIIYLSGFSPGGSDVDTFDVKRLGWDATTRRFIERPVGPLYAVVSDVYPTVAAARAAIGDSCAAVSWVLPARRLALQHTGVVVSAISTSQVLAEASIRPVASDCAKVRKRVVQVRFADVAQ